tara:strand:- start:66 stop:620 length:555 start_codon:yes stop_codon:yes gene_type:complete
MKSTENGKDIWLGVLDYKEVKLTDERLKKGVDTIINIFKKEDMKTKRFETQEDLDREEKAIKLFTREYGYTYEKLGDYDLDFLIKKKDGTVIGVAEVKGRKRLLEDISDLPLAERKYNKIMKVKGAKIIIWAFEDGITYAQLNRLQGIKRNGGRKPRAGSANDVESMYYYDRDRNAEVLTTLRY